MPGTGALNHFANCACAASHFLSSYPGQKSIADHNTLPYELKGVLYLYEPAAKDFLLKKGQRFQMVETLLEGGCRIRFGRKSFGITSCPWLEGFTDHQEGVFRVVPAK